MSPGSATTKHGLAFYAITLALAVGVRFAVPVIGDFSLPATMLTPAIAVVIMLLITREGGFRYVLDHLGLTRPGFRGWPLAIAGPVLIHGVGLAILAFAGLTAFAPPEVSGSILPVVIKIATGLAIGTLLALCEEVGWRGYMLPHLLGLGILPAMLLTGFLHGVWHMPLLLTTDFYHASGDPLYVAPLFLFTLTLAGVFYGFLRLWTGSVWPVAIAHAAANMAWEIASEVSKAKSQLVEEYVGGESGLIMIAGLLIVCALIINYMRSGKYMAEA